MTEKALSHAKREAEIEVSSTSATLMHR